MTTLKAIFSPVRPADAPQGSGSLRLGSGHRLDRWALGFVGVVFLLHLISIPHLRPSMSDTWYHLGVAKSILAEGGIPGWDCWNYAPIGRPHLYPPLLHLIIAGVAAVTGSVVFAGQLCAAVFLPLSLLTIWYCARRLLDPRLALLAMLIPMTDFLHAMVMEAYIAGCLVNILMPLLMVSFLLRRPWWSILILALMYYSHLGFPHCVALGLLLFGLKYRSYLRLAVKVVAISLLLFTPWLSHVLAHLDWLPVLRQCGMPGDPLRKLLSLQSFNLVLLGFGFWGIAVAPRRRPERMLPVYLLLGFLPILFSYGGRYTMHTMPLWAILGATVLGPLLPQMASAGRILGIMLLTLLPLPSVSVMDGVHPLPLTGSHLVILSAVSANSVLSDNEKSEAYKPDCDRLAAYLRKTTAPDDVIHVNTVWIADMIWLLADRRTDSGAWWECSKRSETLYGRLLRDWSQHAVFVCIRPEADAGSVLWDTPPMPGVDREFILGRFQMGIRDPHKLRATGVRVTDWRALSAPGATGRVESTRQHFRWRFDVGRDKLALISAAVPEGRFAGARFRISADATEGNLVFGVRSDDGRDYRWPISIPRANTGYNVRAVFDWMADEAGNEWPAGPVRELYFAYPPSARGTEKTEGDERTVEVTGVELLAEAPPSR